MKQIQPFFALTLLLLGAFSCGTSENPVSKVEISTDALQGEVESIDSESPVPNLDELEPGEGLSIGSQAPEFELPDGNGDLHALADYIGNDKNVVLVFYRMGT